jgi:hypothetical protein
MSRAFRTAPVMIAILLTMVCADRASALGSWTQFPFSAILAPGDSGSVELLAGTSVVHFNGVGLVQDYPPPGTSTACSSSDSCVTIDAFLHTRGGELWFGRNSTDSCDFVRREVAGNWTKFPSRAIGRPTPVLDLIETTDGSIVASTSVGLMRFDGTAWTSIEITFAAADLVADPVRGGFWASYSTGNTITYYPPVGSPTTYSGVPNGYTGIPWVRQVLPTRAGRVYVGLAQGVGELVDSTVVLLRNIPPAGPQELGVSLAEGPFGDLWIGRSESGLIHALTDSTFERFYAGNGLGSNSVRSILMDEAGVLWVATGAGTSRCEGAAWLSIRTADGTIPVSEEQPYVRQVASVTRTADSKARDGARWFRYSTLYRDFLCEHSGGRLAVRDTASHYAMGSFAVDQGDRLWQDLSTNLYLTIPGQPSRCWTNAQVGRPGCDPVVGLGSGRMRPDGRGGLWIAGENGIDYAIQDTVYVTDIGRLPGFLNCTDVRVDRRGKAWFLIITSVPTGPGQLGYLVVFDPADSSSVTRSVQIPGMQYASEIHTFLPRDNGDIWYATASGLFRQSGTDYHLFTSAEGMPDGGEVLDLAETPDGKIWIAREFANGLVVSDGTHFSQYGVVDGLAGPEPVSLAADSLGVSIACGNDGVSFFHPDTVPPHVGIVASPDSVVGTGTVQFTFAGGDVDGHSEDLRYSTQLDDEPPLAYARATTRTLPGLFDGRHVFRVSVMDRALNVSASPAVFEFTVDHTPPQVRLQNPTDGQVVAGAVAIRGTLEDSRLTAYSVTVRPEGSASWDTVLSAPGRPSIGDSLAVWDTTLFPDGPCDLQLTAVNALGLIGTAARQVTIDNHFPPADRSVSVTMRENGGEIYSESGEVRVYFPPHAFANEEDVSVQAMADLALLALPSPPGAKWASPPFRVHWVDSARKAGVLEFTKAILDTAPDSPEPRIFALGPDSTWRDVGGRMDVDTNRLSAAITQPAIYRAFAALPSANRFEPVVGSLQLSAAPRILRLMQPGALSDLTLHFTLSQGERVRICLFNRAGRLVREILPSVLLPPGAMAVHWDGRDRDGVQVLDGVYVATVEHGGSTTSLPIAVVR